MIWWIAIFPQDLALICLTVFEKEHFTDDTHTMTLAELKNSQKFVPHADRWMTKTPISLSSARLPVLAHQLSLAQLGC